MELQAFLKVRQTELSSLTVVMQRSSVPKSILEMSQEQATEMATSVETALAALTARRTQDLLLIQAAGRYVLHTPMRASSHRKCSDTAVVQNNVQLRVAKALATKLFAAQRQQALPRPGSTVCGLRAGGGVIQTATVLPPSV